MNVLWMSRVGLAWRGWKRSVARLVAEANFVSKMTNIAVFQENRKGVVVEKEAGQLRATWLAFQRIVFK